MRSSVVVWVSLAVLVGVRSADFLDRLLSPDLVAVAFSEGGDDAYYFFTVARNVVAGHGATIDGVHWTSGFQPLWLIVDCLAFLAPSDRIAFFMVYLVSLVLWLAGALLFLAFVRRASGRPVDGLAAALVVTLFLCDAQLGQHYVTGMETGLYCSTTLVMLLAFQRYLRLPAPSAFDLRRAIGLGVLAGLFMLVRNDAVFLCGFLILAALTGPQGARRLREMVVAVFVASSLVMPWLAYCQWVAGVPLPQSGLATSSALRAISDPALTVRSLVESLVPLLFVKMDTLIGRHVAIAAVLAGTAAACVIAVTLRPRSPLLDRESRLVLLALAASAMALLGYYVAFSAAIQFYARYFVQLKLLMLTLIALLLVRGLDRCAIRPAVRAGAVGLAALAVASNIFWTVHWFGLPYKGYAGREAYELARSPYAKGATRIGMMESGRLGFMLPRRIVNLDGKMNVDALRALRADRLGQYVVAQDFDYIMLRGFDVRFFDERLPVWREHYAPADTLGELFVFARKTK